MEVFEISSKPVWAVLLLLKLLFFEMQVAMRRVEHKPFAGFQLKTKYLHLPQNLVSNFQFWGGGKAKNK